MYNRVILVGRLTADPELRQTPNGIPVCTFSIAVDRSFATKGGERQTDFIDIVAWRQQAEFVSRYFSKGRAILVEGSLQVCSYTDKNDQKRRAYEVVADALRFVESKNAAQSAQSQPAFPTDENAPPAIAAPAAYSSGSVDDFAEIDDDGDLPF